MKKYLDYLGYVGVVLIVISLGSYLITSVFKLFQTITILTGLVILIAFVLVNLARIREFFSKRSTKYGTNATVTAVLMLTILVMLNFVASRHNYRIDTTKARQFSLSKQTIKILKNLKVDVKATAFFKSDAGQRMRDLLEEYAYHSKKFKYEFVDPDKKPAIAKQYGITSYGTTVIEGLGKVEKINKVSEQDITNAIIKVSRKGKKIVYFTEGHGEKDIDVQLQQNRGADGYALAKKAIENENYEVKKILLASEKKVPSDCKVLVIAGPQTDLLANEKDMVQEYLKKGGSALIMVDPSPSASLADLVSPWGIEVNNDVVLDFSGVGQLFGAGPAIPIAIKYGKSPITEGFQNVMTAYSLARSLKIKKEHDSGINFIELVKTGANSWGETDLQLFYKERKVGYDEGKDKRGPLTIAIVATKKVENDTIDGISGEKRKTRLIVFGDSDFATNGWFHFQRNGDLFLNAISWLAEEEDLVSIRPREPEDRRVTLTKAQSRKIFWLGVILFPMAIVGAGMVIYIRRRK